MNFTYDAYKKLLSKLKENNFHIGSFHEKEHYEKTAIIRHDVDISIEKAYQMACIEKELGIKSIYFIGLFTDFYNVFSKKNTEMINEMINMGHEIGVHFDEKKYENITSYKELVNNIKFEVELLSNILGIKIKTVSMHRPNELLLNKELDLGEIVNVYSPEFFSKYKYVSDSRMNWKEDIIKIIQTDKYNRLHILVHPIWYEEKEADIKGILMNFIKGANQERYNILRKNIKNLEEIITENEVKSIRYREDK